MASLENRIERLEQLLGGGDGDGLAQAEYCSWAPHESPPDVPPGVLLTPATVRLRNCLLAMHSSVPAADKPMLEGLPLF
jgi:hypothetical protein